jgi:hypothetical protein
MVLEGFLKRHEIVLECFISERPSGLGEQSLYDEGLEA